MISSSLISSSLISIYNLVKNWWNFMILDCSTRLSGSLTLFIETKRWVPDLHVFESSRRLHQVFHVLINRERRWPNSSSVGTNDGMRCRQGIVLRQLSRIWQTCYLCLEGFKHQLVENTIIKLIKYTSENLHLVSNLSLTYLSCLP